MNITLSKEIKVGLLALISGSMLYLGFNFLKGINFFSKTITYNAIFKNVDGLKISNPILINGLEVGRVQAIKLIPTNEQILVTFEIYESLPIGDSSQAIQANTDLLGTKAIILFLGKSKNLFEPGDTIASRIEPSFADKISEKLFPIVGRLDSTFIYFNDKLKTKVNTMVDNLESTTLSVKYIASENRQNLQILSKNLAILSQSLIETEKQIKPILANTNAFTDTLSKLEIQKTVKKLNSTLAQVNLLLEQTNSKNGSLGKLIYSDSLHENLNRSAKDLDKLLIDMKERPSRYVHFSVFGKKDK